MNGFSRKDMVPMLYSRLTECLDYSHDVGKEDDEHKAQFNVKECFSIEGCKHLLFGREKLSLKKWQELRLWVLLVDVNTKPKLKTQGSQPKKQDNVATLVLYVMGFWNKLATFGSTRLKGQSKYQSNKLGDIPPNEYYSNMGQQIAEEQDPKRWQWLLQEWNMKKIWTEAYQRFSSSELLQSSAKPVLGETRLNLFERKEFEKFCLFMFFFMGFSSGSFGVGEREAWKIVGRGGNWELLDVGVVGLAEDDEFCRNQWQVKAGDYKFGGKLVGEMYSGSKQQKIQKAKKELGGKSVFLFVGILLLQQLLSVEVATKYFEHEVAAKALTS
ncbi:hypothetical protein Tco_0725746 [Tanacetum coccineum]|uniref:Uncharacterized protein n=1 Tax=Tanacetum coccineum TaxID=301880 RepID=A0ABQ4YFZ4_9ASTR